MLMIEPIGSENNESSNPSSKLSVMGNGETRAY